MNICQVIIYRKRGHGLLEIISVSLLQPCTTTCLQHNNNLLYQKVWQKQFEKLLQGVPVGQLIVELKKGRKKKKGKKGDKCKTLRWKP